MSRRLRQIIPLLLVAALCGCAGTPRTVGIGADELQNHMTQALAVPVGLLQIFDIHLSNPVIRLEDGSDRLTAQLDTRIGSADEDNDTLVGKISISGALRYDAERNAITLADSRIEQLDISNLRQDYGRWLNLLAAKIGEGLLDGMSLYRLKPDELKIGSTRYLPQKFSIVGDKLLVTLQPQPR